MAERLHALTDWLHQQIKFPPDITIAPASSDASFRRYFRVRRGERSYIVMDAPPDKEDCRPFIAVAQALGELGLNVPQVLEANLAQGFLLLSDLGNRPYLNALNEGTVDALYADALRALGRLQRADVEYGRALLPVYDRALLLREMELFRDWFLARHLEIEIDAALRAALDQAFGVLADSALAQPTAWVHRDYHSRNLMVTEINNPGILDFQDAVIGPVTYDLVSLLRDCYIAWPRARVEAWVHGHWAGMTAEGLWPDIDMAQFLQRFDLMGVQRHLKAIGIFARLKHRDGKPGYIEDIPRTLAYVEDVARRYSALRDLSRLLTQVVQPGMRRITR